MVERKATPLTPKERLQNVADSMRHFRQRRERTPLLIDEQFIPVFNSTDKDVTYVARNEDMEIPTQNSSSDISSLEVWAVPPFEESFNREKDISYVSIGLGEKK